MCFHKLFKVALLKPAASAGSLRSEHWPSPPSSFHSPVQCLNRCDGWEFCRDSCERILTASGILSPSPSHITQEASWGKAARPWAQLIPLPQTFAQYLLCTEDCSRHCWGSGNVHIFNFYSYFYLTKRFYIHSYVEFLQELFDMDIILICFCHCHEEAKAEWD